MFRRCFKVYLKGMGKKRYFFWQLWTDLSKVDHFFKMAYWVCRIWKKKKNGKCSWKNVWKYSRCGPWNLHTKISPGQDIPIKEGTHIFWLSGKKEVSCCVRKKKCSMEKFSMLLLAFFLGIVKDTDYLEKIFFKSRTN